MQSERSNSVESIGPYRILRRLGAGGMGEVFLAYDDRLDRQVAIKRIRPEAGVTPERRERFRREARMAARLSHPAIVQVYDILQEGDLDHIVMEHVEGESLQEMVERGPLEVGQVLELARELADGLEAAHRQGIVHRDLKTENVLVTPGGRPKITDFGIAKRLLAEEGEESLTADDAVVGTCRSMSPEQARGEPVDYRTDLFAFGVLLYEALTGISPFAAENRLAILNRVIQSRQTPVRELVPAVPAEVSRLVDNLLEKEPHLRPRSAGQVRRELGRLALSTADLTGGPIPRAEDFSERFLDLPTVDERGPTQRPSEAGSPPDSALTGVDWRRQSALRLAGIVVLVGLGIWAYLALRPPKPPLYVAVLAPEIGTGAGNGEVELLASAVRVALLQGLVSLKGISPQAFEEVDAVTGSPREIARAVAADELVGTRLDCRSEVCRVSLTRRRGADGSVIWSDSLVVSTDDAAVVASALVGRIQQAYSDHEVREGGLDQKVDKRDLSEFLRLREGVSSRRVSKESALIDLAAIRRRSPRFVEAYLLEADILGRRFWASRNPKDFEQALQSIQEAHRLAAKDHRPLFELVDLALQAGKLDLAERTLEDLESLVPGDPQLVERQALLVGARGQGEKALELMRAAVRLQPSSKRLHNLAQMEVRNGQISAARKTLELLLDRSPGNYAGLSLLAQVELSSGDLSRAVQLYSELVRLSPGLAELSNLGSAYLYLGRYAEAAEVFQRALDKQPDHPGLALNLADAVLLLGRQAEAEALYRRVVELIEADPSGSSPPFLTVKAQALAHLGRGPQAVAAVQEALRTAPDQGSVAFEASLVYMLLGEEDSALANAGQAIRQGIGERGFSLPWFASLRRRPDFQELLRQTRPGPG